MYHGTIFEIQRSYIKKAFSLDMEARVNGKIGSSLKTAHFDIQMTLTKIIM